MGAGSLTPELADGIAHGLALLKEGASYRVAAQRAGVDHCTLWAAAKRLETFDEDDSQAARIAAKAAILTEQSVERMLEEIASVDASQVARWATAAARIAGLLDRGDSQAPGTDVSLLLSALTSHGGSVGLQLNAPPSVPTLTPTTTVQPPPAPVVYVHARHDFGKATVPLRSSPAAGTVQPAIAAVEPVAGPKEPE